MDVSLLQDWLAQPRTALVDAIAAGIRTHVAAMRSHGIDFYGYALLPGEPYDIHSLVAVTNSEKDIKVPETDDMYTCYRYSVDEWARWDHDGFATANALLVEANEQFRSMHSSIEGNCVMDDFEIAHADALLDAVVCGLEVAKASGEFGAVDTFLAVWISDSDHEIIFDSVRRLNSEEVVEEFMREFS